jgi:hypothetical protein
MIVCTEQCVYQFEGVCELERAASSGEPGGVCSNRVPPRFVPRVTPGAPQIG